MHICSFLPSELDENAITSLVEEQFAGYVNLKSLWVEPKYSTFMATAYASMYLERAIIVHTFIFYYCRRLSDNQIEDVHVNAFSGVPQLEEL